jgi:(p)ppGpp synthase/HD superfamily hydrolase
MAFSSTFDNALQYAAALHREQTRKATPVPYVSHLLAVSSIVIEHGGTETEAIGALLHDAIEDQGRDGLTRKEIAERFGDAVVAIVDGCTDDLPGLPRGKESWRPRKEAYVAHLAKTPPSTRLVSAADKLHNARSILADIRVLGEALWSRFSGGKDGSLWYYRALVGAFQSTEGTDGYVRLVAELDRTVTEIERLARA